MNLQNVLKELEHEESLCCTSFALYNLLRSYPATLFDRQAPSYENFEKGLVQISGVGPLPASKGLSDRALDAVANGLGLKGSSVSAPDTEAELRKILSSPGTGCLARITLKEGSDSVAGVRHSMVLLPTQSDRKPPYYEALESNGAVGENARFAWKDMARMLCGLYLIEVHGPRRELGNLVAGFGPKRDLSRPPRRPDLTVLRKVFAEFSLNHVMGLEALESAVRSHPQSGVLRAFRAAVQFALSLKPASNPKTVAKGQEEARQGLIEDARQDVLEALGMEPELRTSLPDGFRGPWDDAPEAFSILGALAVSPKELPKDLCAKVQENFRSFWP